MFCYMDLFDYEFIFEDNFNQLVFEQCPYYDTTLMGLVTGITSSLRDVILGQPGVRVISSFCTYDNRKYKVTLVNTEWVPFL